MARTEFWRTLLHSSFVSCAQASRLCGALRRASAAKGRMGGPSPT